MITNDMIIEGDVTIDEAINDLFESLKFKWHTIDAICFKMNATSESVNSSFKHADACLKELFTDSLSHAIEWEDEFCDVVRLIPCPCLVTEENVDVLRDFINEEWGVETLDMTDEMILKYIENSFCEIHDYPDRQFPHQAKPVCTCK